MLKNIVAFIVLVFLFACDKAPQTTPEEERASTVEEYKVQDIVLSEELADPNKEMSGLTWYKDNLIMLPQYAISVGDSVGYLYSISKNDIINSINSNSKIPIRFNALKIIGSGLDEFMVEGSGFEAMVFKGDSVYMSLEKSGIFNTEAYIIKGFYDSTKKNITLDKNLLVKIESASSIDNLGEEAISIWNDEIFTIHEANGRNVVQSPRINLLDFSLQRKGFLNFPCIEYRITDVTKPDSAGIFWALNYFWPGDFNKQKPAKDSLVLKHGVGKTHKEYATIERIVEMQISEVGVKLTKKAPIQLKLMENGTSRNWEGIVKLDNMGFLIVTDKFPTTILGFVKYPID